MCWLLASLSRAAPVDPFVMQLWQVHDDLPHNEVRDVLQTHDGYIWVATPEGVARYTGVHFGIQFDLFHSGNTPAIPNNFCSRLAEDSNGNLWLGLDTGQVVCRHSRDFVLLQSPEGWPRAPIRNMAEVAPGEMLVLSRTGRLARFSLRHAPQLLPFEAKPRALVREPDGRVWLLTPRGLQTLDDTRQVELPGPADAVCVAHAGGLWILAQRRLWHWQKGRWIEQSTPLDALEGAPTCLLETRRGALLIGTATHGLWRATREAGRWDCQRVQGLLSDSILDLCEDHEGSIWVGTAGGGLKRLTPRRARTILIPGYGAPASLLSVTAGPTNDLWIGSRNAGLFHLAGEKVTPQPLPPALAGVALTSLLRTPGGDLWLGTRGSGLWMLQGDNCRPLPGWPWTNATVHALFRSASGAIWVGMSDGLAVRRSNRWERIKNGNVALKDDVRCLTEDSQGNLWYGTAGTGLGCLTPGGISRFSREAGLGSTTVYAVLGDADGTVWAGTQGGGLARVRNGRITTLTAQQGLHHDTIGQILDDGQGRLWLATLGGVVCAEKADLHRCADGQQPTVPALLLDLSDGLQRVDFVCGNQSAAVATPDHRLWFVAGLGLGVVDRDTALRLRNRTPPPMVINGLRANGVEVPLPTTDSSQPLRLAPGTDRLEFRYNALSYIAPRRVRFQYRLRGLDADWTDAGPARTVRFARLPPGQYTFQVRGCNNDGFWNKAGARLDFYLAPTLWQTPWFRIGLACLGIAGIALIAYRIARTRHRRKLLRLEQSQALERERGRIARDMHDEVGAKLTRITVLSRLALRRNSLDARQLKVLNNLSKAARECVRRFDQIVWTVNPQNDHLQQLADYLAQYAVAYFDGTGIECRLSLPADLPEIPLSAAVRNNVLRACEEALGNVLRHSGATTVSISMSLADSRFKVRVKDDGQWRSRPADTPPGHGLANMRQRMADIGGQCEIQHSPGSDTTVEFEFPLSGAPS